MTISEVIFFSQKIGKCPVCHREPVKIGICNIFGRTSIRCIDCFFGPSIDLWDIQKCGHLGPSEHSCGVCEAEQLKEQGK